MSLVKQASTQVGGWLKTTLGTVFGLLSGAVVMWFSPLIDNFVKPAKPIANFAYQAEGLAVTFENRSAGGNQACWDFGDGSPLEFIPAEHPTISHTYKKPGRYTVKLTVRNIVEEANERVAAVDLDTADKSPPVMKADGAKNLPVKPEIIDLSPRKLIKGAPAYAPATFVFDATVDNAQHLVWDFGDGQGLHFGEHNRTWTFHQPGTYQVKVVAFNGSQKCEEVKTVVVEAPPRDAVQLTVRMIDEGIQATTHSRVTVLSRTEAMTSKTKGASLAVKEPATTGCKILKAEIIEDLSQDVKDVVCFVSKDQDAVAISGTITPPLKLPSGKQALAALSAKVRIVEEKTIVSRTEHDPSTLTLDVPGQRQVRLNDIPATWKEKNRKFQFEVRQGDKVLWQGQRLPSGEAIQVNGKNYRFGVTVEDNVVDISIR